MRAKNLSDSELLVALDWMAGEHRELIAKMVEHLAEVERRRLHLGLGHSSLYVYARERLGLSKHEAYLRITAARAAQEYGEILVGLENGELSLTAVKTVAPHLAAHPELLLEAAGKSTREVQRLVAERIEPVDSLRNELRVRPLSGGRAQITCVVSDETAALLEEALDLCMHENPERNPDRVVAKALELLVQKKKKPRGRVPARAERAVPGPRSCSFQGRDGHVCGETRFVELDHIEPRDLGGSDDARNFRWLCRPHNHFEAERKVGAKRVEREKLRASLEREAIAVLKNTGFSAAEAKAAARAAARTAEILELEPILTLAFRGLRSQVGLRRR